ncbi:hypothetical protein Y032_0031g2275 [Ancylostoma ceylanicum]|uniref:Uncharacterized protein n=1 Tax=Ancylostoma ceylanicum TaxID=53326 RepID=A0A016UQK7_9BILA|nr:hypothetical protein Y032_0031g2275 [Ancylostoma ceylanicum]
MLQYIALRDPNNPKKDVRPRPEAHANVKSHMTLLIGVDDESQVGQLQASHFFPYRNVPQCWSSFIFKGKTTEKRLMRRKNHY